MRTVRFYRERRLLQPPRKEGRITWYGEQHLDRLRLIAELLERGHALGGIAELIGAGEDGRDVAELIGLQAALVAPGPTRRPSTSTGTSCAPRSATSSPRPTPPSPSPRATSPSTPTASPTSAAA
ncbi:MerR family transcriptional regulator [Kitasatospora saccharophila]|uniref:MerR family transcriptional regulator n=1 Tax=Kitasatospora saccharophila TaxID=407973 RepID=UPI003626DB7F